jgi:hypothetical protein
MLQVADEYDWMAGTVESLENAEARRERPSVSEALPPRSRFH